ncbi:MAG: DegQ family serine endoprotease [Rhodospirillaceae bacterium]|nr:DegQ family serine endoprotease [Rhodospirillaceae bacterium]
MRFLRQVPVLAALLTGLSPAVLQAQETTVPKTREQVSLTFAPVVKKASPAVVNIYTKRVVRQQGSPLFNDPFFRQFFGPQFEQQFGNRERVENSLGSGVIIRSNGIVLTNNHVIANADQITVVLSDRREFEATVIGRDDRTDIAVLRMKIENETLPALDLANSDAIEVGDLVLAIGNPFGVGQTVTSGIVSALARTNVGVADVQSFIQTDAAINPGNSGGALISSDGRLIGINTAIFSQSGGSIGIGFAIPANLARNVVASLLSEGKVIRPWLGANGQTITPDLARTLNLARPSGLVLERVVPKSPAARSGLMVGDVVLSVNGKSINDVDEFRYVLATVPLGDSVDVRVNRSGAEKHFTIKLEAPPDDPPRQKTTLAGRQPFSGATVVNLNPAVADEMKVEFNETGVLVIDVQGNSLAAGIGIRPGDRVLDINDVNITSVEQMKSAVQKPGPWKISLNRNGQILQSTIKD